MPYHLEGGEGICIIDNIGKEGSEDEEEKDASHVKAFLRKT